MCGLVNVKAVLLTFSYYLPVWQNLFEVSSYMTMIVWELTYHAGDSTSSKSLLMFDMADQCSISNKWSQSEYHPPCKEVQLMLIVIPSKLI